MAQEGPNDAEDSHAPTLGIPQKPPLEDKASTETDPERLKADRDFLREQWEDQTLS